MKPEHVGQLFLVVLAGIAILLFTILVFTTTSEPATLFPFTTLDDNFADKGYTVEGMREGQCMTTEFNVVKIRKGSDGWLIYVTSTFRMVAVHYTIGADDMAHANLVIYLVTNADHTFRILVEEPFDSDKHEGPCQFLDLQSA